MCLDHTVRCILLFSFCFSVTSQLKIDSAAAQYSCLDSYYNYAPPEEDVEDPDEEETPYPIDYIEPVEEEDPEDTPDPGYEAPPEEEPVPEDDQLPGYYPDPDEDPDPGDTPDPSEDEDPSDDTEPGDTPDPRGHPDDECERDKDCAPRFNVCASIHETWQYWEICVFRSEEGHRVCEQRGPKKIQCRIGACNGDTGVCCKGCSSDIGYPGDSADCGNGICEPEEDAYTCGEDCGNEIGVPPICDSDNDCGEAETYCQGKRTVVYFPVCDPWRGGCYWRMVSHECDNACIDDDPKDPFNQIECV